jgi:prepilin signal peptidase PulO-like enzyme (type II secretory pathway)
MAENITLYSILGFIWGFLLPLISSRFAKFMPSDPSTAFMMIFHKARFPKAMNQNHKKKFKLLWKKLIISCFFSGLLLSVLFTIAFIKAENEIVFVLSFLMLSSLLAFIDLKYHVLPDILTVPLLLLGLAFACNSSMIDYQSSINGALYGYFVPFIAGIVMHFRKKRTLGGGDFKMLSALGAWLGIAKIGLAILISIFAFIIFAIYWKKTSGPYGQALAIGAFIALLYGNEILAIF